MFWEISVHFLCEAPTFSYNKTSYCFTERLSVLVLFYVHASWRSVSSIKRDHNNTSQRNGEWDVWALWHPRFAAQSISHCQTSLLKKGRMAAFCSCITEGSCHFSSCNQKTKNLIFYLIHIHSILQLGVFLMCLNVFCVSLPFFFYSFTFCGCWFSAGLCNYAAILARYPWKTHFNFQGPSFFKKGQTKTDMSLTVLLVVVVIQTADWQD